MAAVYEDNFGFWDIDGQEEQAFFEHVQRQSVAENLLIAASAPSGSCRPKHYAPPASHALECGAPE